jgi:hypothetical protein
MSLLNIPNRIKQPSQCCSFCGKSYKKRLNLDKHITICELLQNSKKSKIYMEDDDEFIVPSQYKMYEMLIELGKKYNKLEEKVDNMEKWVVKKKKKINMIEWLNSNIFPNILFNKLIEKIIITHEDIKYLLNNTFYDSLNEVFLKTIYNLNETDNPIFAFIQKSNVFYVYDNLEDEKKGWIELSREKFINFINKVHMKFINVFSEWKKINNEEVKKNDLFATSCDKTLVKLMSFEVKVESIFNKIKNIMYSNMKKDLKALIEFEFEF